MAAFYQADRRSFTTDAASLVPSGPPPSFKSIAPSGHMLDTYSRPPSYSRHDNDVLLEPRLSFARRRRLSIPIFTRRAREDPAAMLEVLTAPGPLKLTIDNGMIYPPPPSNALYHLPRTVTWSGNDIFLYRSLPAIVQGRRAPPRDLALYKMSRKPFTNEVALIPRREGLLAATMRGRRSLIQGMIWDVEIGNSFKLRYANGKWRDDLGTILAIENGGEREGITIVGENLEVQMKDLIVAAWATRMWQGHARVGFIRTLMSGKGTLREAVLPLYSKKKPNVHRATIAVLSTPFGSRVARPFERLMIRGRAG
ncbi:hypothetical protein E6O75_ATG07518 [Venturia nashicola]|uniref:Uncharacterized protein n=1 Tax=Venturia nashicola TaxID=86259 RepID=A0A4Z1PF14_9PEZI|nr:hypothetical protein E6O75_ATG07518 [Venturia nashicola]